MPGRPMFRTMRARAAVAPVALLLVIFLPHLGQAQPAPTGLSGSIVDATGAGIPSARVVLNNAYAVEIQSDITDEAGAFRLLGIAAGSYVLNVEAPGFATRELEVLVNRGWTEAVRVELDVGKLASSITVTAGKGAVSEVTGSPHVVTVRDQAYMSERPLATLGNALQDSPGILVQQTTYGQVSPILRGLTGYHVLNLVDGIRYNNSLFRSGPNQYLAFIDPSQIRRVETVLGPTGTQYGSDSLGGTINSLTASAPFGSSSGNEYRGEVRVGGASADLSAGGGAQFSVANRNFSWLIGGSARRLNDLRAGRGEDSRNIMRRFLDLPAEQIRGLIGGRLQDTGFSHYGANTKLILSPSADHNLTLSYQANNMDRVRQYRNLWGAQGRLQSSNEPETLQFFYGRYERFSLGALDSVSAIFSLNSQRDGSTTQRENFTDTVTTERNDVDVYGYAAQARTHFSGDQTLLFGGDVYNEHVHASRFDTNPVTGTATPTRPLYPNGSLYTTYGLFAEETMRLDGGRFRVVLGGRFTRVRVSTFADRDAFGVTDSSRSFSDLTFNTAFTWNVGETWKVNLLVGRGFRAPNLNDLGAIGLNSLGYEVPASEAAPFGALIGSSAGEDAVSVGRKAGALSAESLYSYELGLTYDGDRFYGRVQVFNADIYSPIVRRTLLFPIDNLPAALGGESTVPIEPTDEQRAQGVAPVSTEIDSLAVKAFVNDGRSRYYGIESTFEVRPSSGWTIEGNYSFMVGRELNPNRNARRLVPQNGSLRARYSPSGRYWLEVATRFAGPQERLSAGDLTDARICAARSRRDIATIFHGGMLSRWIASGIDGALGTPDDVFTPTGETLLDLQNRVLPLGRTVNGYPITHDRTRVPMFIRSDGWISADVLGSIQLSETTKLNIGITNLFDTNHRSHGTGIDAPGFSGFIGLRFSF